MSIRKIFRVGFLGALFAQFLSGFCIWLFSVSPDFLPWYFTFHLFLATLFIGGIASLISSTFMRIHMERWSFWLAFWGVFLSFPLVPVIDIFVLDERITPNSLPLFRMYFVAIEIFTGIILMSIFAIIGKILFNDKKTTADRNNSFQ